jgi:hypothetical protein
MSTLVEFQTPSGPVLIQTKADTPVTAVSSTADGLVVKAEQQLRDSLSAVIAIANEFAVMMTKVQSCSAGELEFGLEVSGKGTIYVVETTATAAFKVTLKFGTSAEQRRS